MIKIICVCGARPNFIKIASLIKAFKSKDIFDVLLVHTGQHYDDNMNKIFFEDLEIGSPDINLGIRFGSPIFQIAEIMKTFEGVVLDFDPDYILVAGDVNSSLACTLTAVKLGVKLIHVEAGLRSFDNTMPEEINRILIDRVSDLLFVTEQSGVDNLRREDIDSEKIHFVGNVMIDTLLFYRDKFQRSDILDKLCLKNEKYAVVTLHRPSNVDDIEKFYNILSSLEIIQRELKLVFPIHPRTRVNIKNNRIEKKIGEMNNLYLLDPLGYIDFLCLLSGSVFVLTDSGGIQEETTILRIPCLTMRENTERPVTIEKGTNCLVSSDEKNIMKNYYRIKNKLKKNNLIPDLWDGKASIRIAKIIENCFNRSI